MLCKVVLTFEPVGEILKCDHSTESCWAVLSRGTVYYDVQRSTQFWVCEKNPIVWPFKWNLLSSTFLWYCLLCCTRWITLTFHPRQKEAITMAAFLVLWYWCRSWAICDQITGLSTRSTLMSWGAGGTSLFTSMLVYISLLLSKTLSSPPPRQRLS